jgi:hypothetical protein
MRFFIESTRSRKRLMPVRPFDATGIYKMSGDFMSFGADSARMTEVIPIHKNRRDILA